MIEATKDMVAIGIFLKELLGKDGVTENDLRALLRNNPGALDETQVWRLMTFIRMANKCEQLEFKVLEDAFGYVQIGWQCGGFLNPPERREIAQHSHALTPAAQSVDLFMETRRKYNDLEKTSSEWSVETYVEVEENADCTIAYMVEFKARIRAKREAVL